MFASDEDDIETLPVSEEVKAYEPLIQQYANEHDLGGYVLLIQAVMMQESGGRETGPMQCSKCDLIPGILMLLTPLLTQSILSMWASRILRTAHLLRNVKVPWIWTGSGWLCKTTTMDKATSHGP